MFWNTFSPPRGLLALSPSGPRFSQPTEEVTTNIYLSLLLTSGNREVHHMTFSSARGEIEWEGASMVSWLAAGVDSTQLNIVVSSCGWVAMGLSTFRLCIMSWWLIATNSCTVCCNSLMLSAKEQKSGFLGKFCFSSQYWRLWAQANVRSAGCCHMSWYASFSGRKVLLIKLQGARGAVKPCSGDALIQTSRT